MELPEGLKWGPEVMREVVDSEDFAPWTVGDMIEMLKDFDPNTAFLTVVGWEEGDVLLVSTGSGLSGEPGHTLLW